MPTAGEERMESRMVTRLEKIKRQRNRVKLKKVTIPCLVSKKTLNEIMRKRIKG